MTEKEFLTQVWKAYDVVSIDGIADNLRVQNVCFSTRSVRVKLPGDGMPEWFKCDLIKSHTTQRGDGADDASIIEDLHNRILKAEDIIVGLRNEKKQLQEKLSGGNNYEADILRCLNMIKEGLTEKKNKIEKVENGLLEIQNIRRRLNME